MEERASEQPYYNRGLFSEHYLLHRLSEHPVWQEYVYTAFSQALSLYQKKKEFLPTYNERQTEEEFIQPLFSILGFAYTPQVRFKRHEQVSVPDFALFISEESKRDAELTRQSRDDFCEKPFFKRVAALAEAKYWGRTLDVRVSDKRDNPESRNRNPHFQITRYLTDSGVPRGILTNGTHWRLYFSSVESQEILYYEVELLRILEEENESDFRYFYHFFNTAAFEPDAEGRTFLDEVFEQSRSYAKQVEERLKERIFEQVVPALARGFFAYRRDVLNIHQETEESLREMFNGTLLFLYRLIFLLYAEARELLPVTERQGYFAYSLTKLKQTIFDEQKTGRRFSDVSTTGYDALKSSFAIINRGDASLNVPRYNGGLFAPDGLGDRFIQGAAEFLENHAIADSYLAKALMLLTRDLDGTEDVARILANSATDARFIDYRDLNVRHLGSIYEGLLEFKLKIAQQPLVKAREKGKDVYKPFSDAGQILPDVQAGDIYLTNDKSERKATGSYYTPDYIVRYIVENTVGPLIDGILKECRLAQDIRSGSRSWDELFEELLYEKSEKEQKAQREAWKLTRNDGEKRQFLSNMLDGVQPEHDYDAIKRILELKILDPAIGSGHFLVGAMDFLTRKLVAFLERFPDSPVLKEIEETRQKIVAEAERQNVRIDTGTLDDENLLRRMVMKRCLYGVDVNPMAVELAKLSLWLHGFTVGAPLSFLDHHLRCGNSLIGATVEEVREHLQRSLFGQQFAGLLNATDMMQQLAELTDATFTDVQESQSLYDKAQNALAPFKGLLDVWVSKHFGNDDVQGTLETFPEAIHNALKHLLNGDVEAPQNSKALQVSQKALELRDEKNFFHWELEFPEVWYERGDERENPGFDAVIGNPPYGLIKREDEKAWVRLSFKQQIYQVDYYNVFLEQSMRLCRTGGIFSMIVPNTWLLNVLFKKFRDFVLINGNCYHIRNYRFPVFEEAVVDTCVMVGRPGITRARQIIIEHMDSQKQLQSNVIDYETFALLHRIGVNLLANPRLLSIAVAAFRVGCRLTENAAIVQGCKPFQVGKGNPPQTREIVTQQPFVSYQKRDESFRPLLRGSLIARYSIMWNEDYWISYGDWLAEPRYTANFDAEKKLFIRQTGDSLVVTLDEHQFIGRDNLYVIHPNRSNISNLGLLAILNSRMLTSLYRAINPEIGEALAQIKREHLVQLPIRRIFFITSQDEREQQVAELKSFYEGNDYDNILTRIDELLPKNTDGNFLAFVRSISVKDAIAKGHMTKQDAEKSALKKDTLSGYGENGNPLEKSDVVHDFLAFLAEQMIEMNRAKRTQIGRFWTDLEGVTDANTFAKLQKGKQERSLARKEPLRQFVNPESASSKRLEYALEWTEEAFKEFVKVLVSRIPNLSDFLDVYRKYAPAVQTLAQRVQATDELIDQIVYRLYGLTEEEVKIVEESVKR